MKSASIVLSIIFCIAITGNAAEISATKTMRDRPDLPALELQRLLDQVAKISGRDFLIHREVPSTLVTGSVAISDVDYAGLLAILRNNGMAAVTIGGHVNVIPVRYVRQHSLPIVNEDTMDIADDEWVTRVIQLQNGSAAHFVPILRPILPQAGHLVANAQSNSLLIVDRYANVKRVSDLVRELDVVSDVFMQNKNAAK